MLKLKSTFLSNWELCDEVICVEISSPLKIRIKLFESFPGTALDPELTVQFLQTTNDH